MIDIDDVLPLLGRTEYEKTLQPMFETRREVIQSLNELYILPDGIILWLSPLKKVFI